METCTVFKDPNRPDRPLSCHRSAKMMLERGCEGCRRQLDHVVVEQKKAEQVSGAQGTLGAIALVRGVGVESSAQTREFSKATDRGRRIHSRK